MEEWASELESIDMEMPEFEPADGEVKDAMALNDEGNTEADAEDAWWAECLEQVQAVAAEIE